MTTLRDKLNAPRSAKQRLMDALQPSQDARALAGIPRDWTYFDMPGMFEPRQVVEFRAMLGEGNYQLLSHSTRASDGLEHAQFFISPLGMARLAQFLKEGIQ